MAITVHKVAITETTENGQRVRSVVDDSDNVPNSASSPTVQSFLDADNFLEVYDLTPAISARLTSATSTERNNAGLRRRTIHRLD